MRSAQTLEALQNAPDVRDCSVFGNALHVLVRNAEKSLSELPGLLAAKGLPPRHMAQIAPTLEDVFVQLIAADGAARRVAA